MLNFSWDTYAVQVSDDDMILGAPVSMVLMSDSLLSIYDARKDNYIWWLNVNNGTYSSCLHRGEGPNESFGVNNISLMDGDLFVSSSQDNKLFRISIDADSLSSTINTLGTAKTDVLKGVMISDDEIIYAPFFEDSVRFVSAKISGEVVDTIGRLDFIAGEGDFVPRNSLAPFSMAVSKDRDVMVASNLGRNIIEVIDLIHNK